MADKKEPIVDELTAEFISEIKEDLRSLEPDLLAMEEKGSGVDADLINHAFRAIHSIKGGAGFINFSELADLANAMENVFMHVREAKLMMTSEIVDSLLAGFDKMKLLVETIGSGRMPDVAGEQQHLETVLFQKDIHENQADLSLADSPVTAETGRLSVAEPDDDFDDHIFTVEKKCLDRALEQQKFIFAVHVHPGNDLEKKNRPLPDILDDIRDIGILLFSGDVDSIGSVCVVATILDKLLLAQALEIDVSRIVRLEKEPVRPVSFPWVTDIPEENVSPKSQAPDSVRINLDLISSLMSRAGELVLMRNQIKPYIQNLVSRNSFLDSMLQNLDMVTTDIHESIMQMRMQPISDLLGKYKRVVRDIARKLSKEVSYSFTGGEVELDRNVLENLANPFIHLIRNSVDHGIETLGQRVLAGKPETGRILIQVCHLGGHVRIDISDDGAGIDPEAIARKAYEKELITSDQVKNLSAREKINLIFLPGFSMSDGITDISGRGVGLDVVKTNIEALNGSIDIESVPGKGTTFKLIIPLTLSIIPALITGCGQSRFAVPQVSIREILFMEPGQICSKVDQIGGAEVLRFRDHFIPVVRLRNVLGIDTYIEDPATGEPIVEKRRRIADRRSKHAGSDDGEQRTWQSDRRNIHCDATYIIILKLGSDLFGLCVDEVYDIEEIVVEPLSEPIRQCRCFSGATILGNGRIIMIIDVPGLALAANLAFEEVKQAASSIGLSRPSVEPTKDLLVFSSAPKEFFAVEPDQVSRIEAIVPSDIHTSGRQRCMGREEIPFPVFSLDEVLPVNPPDLENPEDLYLIIPKHAHPRVGILASAIIDIFQATLQSRPDSIHVKGVKQQIMLDNRMIQILDMEMILTLMESKIA